MGKKNAGGKQYIKFWPSSKARSLHGAALTWGRYVCYYLKEIIQGVGFNSQTFQDSSYRNQFEN